MRAFFVLATALSVLSLAPVALAANSGEAPPRSSPQMPLPKPGQGAPGEPWVSDEVDGEIFRDAPNGGVLHPATGFVCPAEMDGFKRSRLVIFDAARNGRDVACIFTTQDSWFSLYLTQVPGMTADAVFQSYLEDANQFAGSRKDAAPLLAPGLRPLPTHASFWTEPDGSNQGMWMTQSGDWFIKLRVTYIEKDKAAVSSFARDMFIRINTQVPDPGV